MPLTKIQPRRFNPAGSPKGFNPCISWFVSPELTLYLGQYEPCGWYPNHCGMIRASYKEKARELTGITITDVDLGFSDSQ